MINLSNPTNLSFNGYLVKHNSEKELEAFWKRVYSQNNNFLHDQNQRAKDTEMIIFTNNDEINATKALIAAATTQPERNAVIDMAIREAEANGRVLDLRV